MRLRLKRMRELCAVFCSLVRQDGLSATAKRALGFARRRLKSKKASVLKTVHFIVIRCWTG